ncbi:hypothetical protein [Polynucleobacter nymphae]|nr:hypothetical protein [Polynucleobacter nymphae]MBU3608175.1 hypothetical protein [Polynucleobacter nymphae]
MKRILKTAFAAMFILMLVACSATGRSSGGYGGCQNPSDESRCIAG